MTTSRTLPRSAGALLLAGLAAMAPLAAPDYPGVSNKAYGDLADALVDILRDQAKNPPPAAGGGGGGSFYMVRGAVPATTAGPMESLFVSMISALPQEVVMLARQWDKTPGLPAQARTWLAGHEFLREPLQRVTYVKEHHRMSPNAPAATDLCKAFEGWIDLPSSA